MLQKLIFGGVLLSLLTLTSSAQAQFGRLGPVGLRPPMPPIPMPVPLPAGPGYLRVPGFGPVAPPIAVRPSYGYVRPTAVIVPVIVPSVTTAARVAVVQPVTSPQYRAGSASYDVAGTPRPASQTQAVSSGGSELRPGMVLPDGAIVVSVGQPANGSSAPQTIIAQPIRSGSNPPGPTMAPQPSATPSPVPGGTQSILEPTEELPLPQATEPGVASGGVRKF